VAGIGGDENPLHIVDDDEDDSALLSPLERADAAVEEFTASLDVSLEDSPTVDDSDRYQTSPTVDVPPTLAAVQRQRLRPFGTASEYLRIKREHNEAQRAQAQRLSIRQLSAFLGKKMQ
jgi:hypothetical protein